MKKKYIVTQSNDGKVITLQFKVKKRILEVKEGDIVELEKHEYENFRHVFTPMDEIERKRKIKDLNSKKKEELEDILKKEAEKEKLEKEKVAEEAKIIQEPEIDEKGDPRMLDDEDEKGDPRMLDDEDEKGDPRMLDDEDEKGDPRMIEVEEDSEDEKGDPRMLDDEDEKGDLESLKYTELKKLCADKNLDIKGKKSELIQRLKDNA